MTLAIKTLASGQSYALSGALDAASGAPLAALAQTISAPECVIDLSGIKTINSVGARHWAAFARQLAAKTALTLERCSVFFIDYVNLVPEIAFVGKIASFQAPLTCPACGRHELVLVDAEVADVSRRLPTTACGACGKTMQPDVDVETYLGFFDAR